MFKLFGYIRFSLVAFIFLYYGSTLDLFLLSNSYVGFPPTMILLVVASAYLMLVLLEPGKATLNRIAYNFTRSGAAVASYVLFCLVFVIWGVHSTANYTSGGSYIYLSIYNLFLFVVGFVAFSDSAVLSRWKVIVALPLLLLVLSLWVETKFPLLFSDDLYGRKSGIAGNPNAAAYFMIVMLLMLVDLSKPKIPDLIFFGLCSLGIFATFSRGGYLLAILLGLNIILRVFISGDKKSILTLIAGCGLMVIFFNAALVELDVLELGAGGSRMELILNGEWSELARGEGTMDRKELFDKHVALALESPVFGHGTGYTYTGQEGGGPHNVYLQIWCNQGIAGVVSVLLMLFFFARFFVRNRNYKGLLFVFILFAEGLLNHNIFDQRPTILFMAAFVALTASGSWYARKQRGLLG